MRWFEDYKQLKRSCNRLGFEGAASGTTSGVPQYRAIQEKLKPRRRVLPPRTLTSTKVDLPSDEEAEALWVELVDLDNLDPNEVPEIIQSGIEEWLEKLLQRLPWNQQLVCLIVALEMIQPEYLAVIELLPEDDPVNQPGLIEETIKQALDNFGTVPYQRFRRFMGDAARPMFDFSRLFHRPSLESGAQYILDPSSYEGVRSIRSAIDSLADTSRRLLLECPSSPYECRMSIGGLARVLKELLVGLTLMVRNFRELPLSAEFFDLYLYDWIAQTPWIFFEWWDRCRARLAFTDAETATISGPGKYEKIFRQVYESQKRFFDPCPVAPDPAGSRTAASLTRFGVERLLGAINLVQRNVCALTAVEMTRLKGFTTEEDAIRERVIALVYEWLEGKRFPHSEIASILSILEDPAVMMTQSPQGSRLYECLLHMTYCLINGTVEDAARTVEWAIPRERHRSDWYSRWWNKCQCRLAFLDAEKSDLQVGYYPQSAPIIQIVRFPSPDDPDVTFFGWRDLRAHLNQETPQGFDPDSIHVFRARTEANGQKKHDLSTRPDLVVNHREDLGEQVIATLEPEELRAEGAWKDNIPSLDERGETVQQFVLEYLDSRKALVNAIHVVARDESRYLAPDDEILKLGEKLYGIYWYDPSERTYIASLDPTRLMHFFEYTTKQWPEDDDARELLSELLIDLRVFAEDYDESSYYMPGSPDYPEYVIDVDDIIPIEELFEENYDDRKFEDAVYEYLLANRSWER